MTEVAPLTAPPPFPGANAPFAPEKGFSDWGAIVARDPAAWEAAKAAADGAKVLVGSNTGMHGAVSTFDSVVMAGLTMAGARVEHALCDGILQGCLIATHSPAVNENVIADRGLVSTLCKACFNRGTNVARPLGLPEHRLSAYLTETDYTDASALAAGVSAGEVSAWTLDGLPIGEHAYAGALRYFATGDLSAQPRADEVVRRYLEGAILCARAYERMIEAVRPDVAVLHHGIYSPQGVAAAVCRAMDVRVATWVVAYRKNCFIFSHDDTYHHTMMSEPISAWENVELSPDHVAGLREYLASRATGGKDWIYFHKDPEKGFPAFAEERGIDTSKPVIAMLTNVMWDAQLHYPANAFASMKDWIVETVRYFIDRDDVELVIRVHPAEVRGALPSRQRVADVIDEAFPELPRHIHVVRPDEEASTYAIANAANAVVIFGTKMGTELTPMGKPLVVAGEAWIRNKGLTQDAETADHYFRLLDQLPLADGEWVPDIERAERYAYHFFYRRMIPLPFMEPNGTGAMFDIAIDTVRDLEPGRHPGLDVITRGVVDGAPFIYEAERIGSAERSEVKA